MSHRYILCFAWILAGASLIGIASVILIQAGLPQRALYTGQIGAEGILYAPEIGAYAPLFQRERLTGGQLVLAELRGQVVLINFWATWCQPCEQEMPILQLLHEQYGERGLAILAVNMGEARQTIQQWVERLELSFIILLDTEIPALADIYRLRGQPSTFILSPSGKITAIFYGSASMAQLEGAIQPLLSASK